MDFRSLSMQLGFRILIVSGILDSLSCIPDSKTQDFGFQSLAEFWIPRAVFRIPGKPRIPNSTGQNFPDPGSRIPLYGAIGTNNDG